jgi:drug/metabolite transporter (DMT)-like permease
LIYLKLILTACFWGGTFIAGKMIANRVDPVCGSFLRFAIASVFLLTLTLRVEGRIPVLRRQQIIPVTLLGLTGVFAYNILFLTGLKYIDAGRAALIIATNPIIISLLSALIFKERLSWIKALGICLSVMGAMLVISNGRIADLGSYRIGAGELLIAGCVLCWVAYSLIGKSVMAGLSPLASVTYSAGIGGLLLMFPAWYHGLGGAIFSYSFLDWLNLFYLGFFGTVLGFCWYYQGIEHIGAMKASVFINFVPISAIILAFLILKEPITVSLFLGALLVILGVYLTNTRGILKRRRRPALLGQGREGPGTT